MRYTSQLTAEQDMVDWSSSNKLCGLHPETVQNENQQTCRYVTRSRGLAWTCGHVHWPINTC